MDSALSKRLIEMLDWEKSLKLQARRPSAAAFSLSVGEGGGIGLGKAEPWVAGPLGRVELIIGLSLEDMLEL